MNRLNGLLAILFFSLVAWGVIAILYWIAYLALISGAAIGAVLLFCELTRRRKNARVDERNNAR
jgi:hypothetical protein